MFRPGSTGWLLFADHNDLPVLGASQKEGPGVENRFDWLPPYHPNLKNKIGNTKYGYGRSELPVWDEWASLHIEAMVLTGNALFVAGPPDVLKKGDGLAAFEGRAGAILRAVDKKEGTTLADYELDSPPVFDGMMSAYGKVFICTADGRIRCFASTQ
jgi:hypothetical protein